MSNQINNSLPKIYDASEMHDAVSLAAHDMNWMNTAISHIRAEVRKLNKLAEEGKNISQYHFTGLIHHIDMYEYLAELRHEYHANDAERLEKEWKSSIQKAGV